MSPEPSSVRARPRRSSLVIRSGSRSDPAPGRDRRRALAAPDGLGSRLKHEELPRTLWSRAHGPLDVLWPSQRALRALADLRDANDLVVVEAGQPALLRGELEAAHLTRRRVEPIREGLVRDRPGANLEGDLVHGE